MKTIGIIGGMGAAATADLFSKIIAFTDASADQEHVPLLIDNNTAIADRTGAILGTGADPFPELCRSAKRLEAAGAEALIMACNTAHYYYDRLAACINIPFLHMPRETAKRAAELGLQKLALLATSGTIQSGVYSAAFQKGAPGIELLLPSKEEQKEVMHLIYDIVKADRWTTSTECFSQLLRSMSERGAEAFLLGCTELPVAFQRLQFNFVTLDPTAIIAETAVSFAGAKLKEYR